MVTVLVVDDSAVDRLLAGRLLTKREGLSPIFATHGREALEVLRRERVDVVVTDLQMPEMDGLSLVQAIRSELPWVPVILMTAHGSEETAVLALQRGAASYVPKRNLAQDLASTVENVLEITKVGRTHQQAIDRLVRSESVFRIGNDIASIAALVGYLEESHTRMKLGDQTGLVQIAVALHEALVNAIEHGNLELSSDLREVDYGAYASLADARRAEAPYRDRLVTLTARETRDRIEYVVEDEGPGFDTSSLPDPTDPANLEKASGRGLLLIRTFMDEVTHNEKGNAITMVKRYGDTSSAQDDGAA